MRKNLWSAVRSAPRKIAFATVLFELLALASTDAMAVPSYTRRYGVECAACHSVWGALTQAGNTFKLSGYRSINGAPAKTDTPDIELARGDLTIPASLPLSFVTGVGFDSRTEKRTFTGALNAGATGSLTQSGSSLSLEDASIFMSSPIGPNLAAFVEFPMYEARAWEFTPTGLSSVYAGNFTGAPRRIQFNSEQPGFEVAKFFWNNILGDKAPRDSVNLLFGITHLPLAYSPGKVRLPVNQHLIYERRALDLLSRAPVDALLGTSDEHLFRLSEPQGIVELFGMWVPGAEVTDVKSKPWVEYHLGISNGSNAKSDNNSSKDVYGRVTWRGYGQSVGFFGLHSPNTYDDTMYNTAAGYSDPIGHIMSTSLGRNTQTTYGPNFTVSMVPFGMPVSLDNDILFRQESNPTGYGVPFKWKGGMHQLNWFIDKQTSSYLKYDWIRGDRFSDIAGGGTTLAQPKENDFVLGIQHLISPNQKLIAEYRTHKFEDLAGAGQLRDDGMTLRFMLGF